MTPDDKSQDPTGAAFLARALSNGHPEPKLGSSWVYGLHHLGRDQGSESEGSKPFDSRNPKVEEK